MKFKTLSLVAAVAALFVAGAYNARAVFGFDYFATPRTLVFGGPQNFGPITAAATTNGPIDARFFDGIAKVDIVCSTNTGNTGGTMTAQIYGSNDQTNFTALSGYAVITSPTSVAYTNLFYGSPGLQATNKYLLPGTITTPVAATAGFAAPYLAPLAYTNAGPITVTTSGIYELGFNIDDAPRYLYVVWTPGGTVTNFTGSAILTGGIH